MEIRDEILEVKKEVEQIQEQSLAMELLKDQKRQNKRMFIIILVTLCMLFITIGYLIYILNDAGTEITTQEVNDIENVGGDITNG